MTFLLFIFVLLVTVLVHEWGHFWTAKRFGMLVEEFGFGIPPRLWSWKKGETRYSINALPFGGFVKIAGENGDEPDKDPARQFEARPWYAKSVVLVAGVVCNILLAVLLFTVAFSVGSPSISETGTPTIIGVTKDSPAEKAGLSIGEKVTSAQKGNKTIAVDSTETLRSFINKETTPITFTVGTESDTRSVTVTPVSTDDGVMVGLGIEKVGIERYSIGRSFILAIERTWIVTKNIFNVVGALLASLFGGEKVTGLVGPVGIAQEVRSASAIGFTYLLSFIALISINLAVLNILPFPALDGGRLIIVLLEAVFRRKFSKTVIGLIHTAGFFILISLMLFLTVKDIRGLF